MWWEDGKVYNKKKHFWLKREMGSLSIATPFILLGLVVTSTYVWLAKSLWYAPEDTKHIWGGLKSGKGVVFWIWCVGELMTWRGFLSLTAHLWKIEDVGTQVYSMYCCFMLFSAAWAPLALDKLYNLAICDLLGVAISAWGLLFTCLPIIGIHAWWAFPVAMHTTFMDFCFWSYTWKPPSTNHTIIIDTSPPPSSSFPPSATTTTTPIA